MFTSPFYDSCLLPLSHIDVPRCCFHHVHVLPPVPQTPNPLRSFQTCKETAHLRNTAYFSKKYVLNVVMTHYSVLILYSCKTLHNIKKNHDTVDGRNSAPADMVNIPWFTKLYTSPVVSRISSINSSLQHCTSARPQQRWIPTCDKWCHDVHQTSLAWIRSDTMNRGF